MKIREKIASLVRDNVNFSDVLIEAGEPFHYRIPSGMMTMDPGDIFEDADITEFLEQTRNVKDYSRQIEENGGHLDFSIDNGGVRYRCDLFWFGGQRQFGLTLRKLNAVIPMFETLDVPPAVKSFADRSSGLVLVTGPTGSGKSTTLASLIAYINQSAKLHIITLEDPIEYVHTNQSSVVTQREVGQDTSSFSLGLTSALRQDPDVILIGEIRDKATAEAALTAAETGHLVFSTLHTTSAAKTVERLTDFFSGDEKELMRGVLSSVLVGICSQVLVPDLQMKRRVLASEVMVNTPAIAAMIRQNKLQQIPNEMATGSKDGMTLMNKELLRLITDSVVSRDIALRNTYDPVGLQAELGMRTT